MSDNGLEAFVIDLDAERNQRAAAREGKQQPLPIRIGGETIATLPVELPLDVIEPLASLDSDLTMVLRYAVDSVKNADTESRMEATDMVINILAANPALPVSVLNTITQVAKNLLTDEGFTALMAARPSAQDLAALARGVVRFYGVSLGESLPSSGSPEGSGGTSKPTSLPPTPASTSATSTPTPGPATPTAEAASSESAAS